MPTAPEKGRHYDSYEPEKYGCVSVDDKFIFPLSEKMKGIKCYWHTLDQSEFGLAYCGITLIPPESLRFFIEWICHDPELSDLMRLLKEAQNQGRYVIHFGI